MEEKADSKCPKCKSYKYPREFLNTKNRTMKTCVQCRDRATKYRNKNKCEHGRQRNKCKGCDGSQICFHERRKARCKDCMNDEQKIEFIKKTMISSSKQYDKKYACYDANNFIDMCFLTELFEEGNTCHYCSVEFTYNERRDTLVTIERLNNNVGHIKSNCVLACWGCNLKHKGKTDIRE